MDEGTFQEGESSSLNLRRGVACKGGGEGGGGGMKDLYIFFGGGGSVKRGEVNISG